MLCINYFSSTTQFVHSFVETTNNANATLHCLFLCMSGNFVLDWGGGIVMLGNIFALIIFLRLLHKRRKNSTITQASGSHCSMGSYISHSQHPMDMARPPPVVPVQHPALVICTASSSSLLLLPSSSFASSACVECLRICFRVCCVSAIYI